MKTNATETKNLKRNNHFLSQMYLDAWKNSNNRVMVYQLLVPNEKVPLWVSKSTKSIGSIDSLFVRLKNNEEIDDIEDWFATKYESPAKEALEKAKNDAKISADEWHRLIDFLACHIVRSPAFLANILERANRECVPMMEEKMKSISTITLAEMKKTINRMKADENSELFPIKFTDLGDDVTGENKILKIETIFGKQFYLWSMKSLLEGTTKILHKHKWSIITVDEKVVLPTSDNPVICLNYNNEKDYNFNGGWESENSNILFPISPNKVLYTQIGVRYLPRLKLNYEMSLVFKKIIVEHSFRYVISNSEDNEIPKIKSRYVNLYEFNREKEMWKVFQKAYIQTEAEYIK